MLWWIVLLPWLLFGLVVPFTLRRRPRLRDAPLVHGPDAPLVSVIVPARNEASNIAACMATIIASHYPSLELIVVDDRSVDGTLDIAQAIAGLSPIPVQVLPGDPLPAGWLGKSWACWQGVAHARGELLAFTDADTRHAEELMGHAVAALRAAGAQLLSVAPHQLMLSFWERLLQPHVFALLWLRWRDPAAVQHARRPGDAMAGGQFMLLERTAYDAAGGHAAVRAEVVEDLALGQRIFAAGGRLYLGLAPDLIKTRMYRGLGELVEGWSKNLAAGTRLTTPPWLRPVAPWLLAIMVLALWFAPPMALVAAALGAGGRGLLTWAAGASAAGLFFWIALRARYRAHPLYALLYPLGAGIVGWLLIRSITSGDKILWKGRRYGPVAEAGKRGP